MGLFENDFHLVRKALKARIAFAAIPVVRSLMNLFPKLRRPIWHRIIQGRLDWRSFPFVERVRFGAIFSGSTSDILQRYLYYFGCWEPHVEAVLASCLKPGDTFIDVGANIGYFTLFAANRVGEEGKVISIEASAITFARLATNVRRNSAGTVRLIHAAIADKEGLMTLHSGPEDNSGMASIVRSQGTGRETVPTKPLGTFLSEEILASVRLIKIDVEGAEGLVIEGMIPILPILSNADLLIEINPHLVCADQIFTTLDHFGWIPFKILPMDSLENYFNLPVVLELAPLTNLPSTRMDVLFRRKT